jgi:crotonobetainyl-CoA:carnitine CoA-transferase CaiB-like acyl-CoA transferase
MEQTGGSRSASDEMLLAGIRVIDMAEQSLETAARLLGDLGADVIRVEPPYGAASRQRPPFERDTSIYFATRNANKRGVTLDMGSVTDREKLWQLLASADIWIETTEPGTLEHYGLDPDAVLRQLPHLVILSGTDFGQTGPYRNYVGSDPVLLALGTQLSRSGKPRREPLIPPGGMSYEVAAVQAAWATALAYYQRMITGIGDWIDFSVFESAIRLIDPPYGTIGTAISATQSTDDAFARLADRASRTRPATNPYPIVRCADGYVRTAVLTTRQWHAMRAWLGEPEQFQDKKYDTRAGRVDIEPELYLLYEELARTTSMVELTQEGQTRGIPIAPVMTTSEVLNAEHFEARGAFVLAEIAPGMYARVPSGSVEVDGDRLGFRHRAPTVGEHNDEILEESGEIQGEQRAGIQFSTLTPRLPLEGIRICDLGAVLFGAEVSRNLADMGAEVIKVETSAFPDVTRQSAGDSHSVSRNFAIGNRNKKCIGLNLRTREGVEILKRLVADSDVFLSNFKPGTLERLGLSFQELAAVNPRLIWMSATGVGHTGPWGNWLGYGPLGRCVSGLTNLWRYPEDPASFCDAVSFYPDHYAARVACLAVTSALIRRARNGQGAEIRISQAETIINMLAEEFVKDDLRPGSSQPPGNTSETNAPWNVYQCAGDDEWCVITVRDDDDWSRLVAAMGAPSWAEDSRFATAASRIAEHKELDAHISAWTGVRTPSEVMQTLQSARVAAGKMVRQFELQNDEHLQARQFLASLVQPGLPHELPVERRPFHSRHIPAPPLRPAAKFGEHTREICKDVLNMSDEEIEDLIEAGVLEDERSTTN